MARKINNLLSWFARTKKENIIHFSHNQVTDRLNVDMTKDEMYHIIYKRDLENVFLERLNYCNYSIDYIYISKIVK